MCANVDQMCDRMCTKVLTTDNTVPLLSQESTTEQETTEMYTICGYQLGVLHGPYPLCPLYILELYQLVRFSQRYATWPRPFKVTV